MEEIINKKNLEINDIKNYNNGITYDKPIAIYFTSIRQDIHRPICCRNADTFVDVEKQIYNEYPQYKEFNTYLTVNGNLIKRFKTLDENGIKEGNTVIVNVYEG